MDIILNILGLYLSGILVLFVLTFTINKLLPNKGMDTDVEDLIEIGWWSWFGVVIFIVISIIEFSERIKISEKFRNFYEAKKENE